MISRATQEFPMHKFAVIAILALAACEPVSAPFGGSGQTTRGEQLIAEAILRSDRANSISISGQSGWTCAGSYEANTSSALRQFPLSCSNGVTGTATMVVNAPTAATAYQRASVNFVLSNGTSGTVQFGVMN